MSLAYAVSDAQVMVTRSTRRSLRDPEAFFTASQRTKMTQRLTPAGAV